MQGTLKNHRDRYGTPEELAARLHHIVDTVSLNDYDGNVYLADTDGHALTPWEITFTSRSARFKFRLRCHDYKRSGWRYSASGRRMLWASWEAHRDVLRALFDFFGDDLTVRTAMATYKGPQGFLDNYHATGNVNIGSQIAPTTMPDQTA